MLLLGFLNHDFDYSGDDPTRLGNVPSIEDNPWNSPHFLHRGDHSRDHRLHYLQQSTDWSKWVEAGISNYIRYADSRRASHSNRHSSSGSLVLRTRICPSWLE